jgi:RecA/RadA recombinase
MLHALELVPELASQLITAQRLEERRGQRGSGVPALDELLGGGWPRAALSEISGRRSTGRTSVMLATLARALAAGEAAALVDTGGALDPRAALAAGVALPRLLWIRCAAAAALKATDLVVSAGGFDVVVLDLGDERPRVPTASWVRLKHGAERQGTSVLVATATRAVGAFAAAAIELEAATPHFLTDAGPPLLDGARAKMTYLRRAGRSAAEAERGERSATCAWLAFSCPS